MKIKIIVVLVLLVATAVYAQDKFTQRKLEAGFAAFDRDKDDALDHGEFKTLGEFSPKLKGQPQVVDYIFAKLDVDRNGKLSRSEYMKITTISSEQLAAKKPQEKPAEPTPAAEASEITSEQSSFFEKKIRPVLIDRCYGCHSEQADEIGGGLVLDTREGMRRGGTSGPGVVPGNLDQSLIVEAIRYTNKDLQMPPEDHGGKLDDAVVADFEAWIKMGAPDPRDGNAMEVKSEWDTEKARLHWSYQPIVAPESPKINNADWPNSEIDRFVLAGLEAKGIAPVGDATPEALVRRLYFDLIGLPPPLEVVEAFVSDYGTNAQAAVEKTVDHLLDSPSFGERWGRHWLDVARYAESTGKDVNLLMPHNWRYRDYVIDAFNRDKPIDDFIREQIAGDLLPAENDRDRAMKQIATGFLAIGARSLNERNPKQFALDTADEQIDAVSQAFLGVTVACARCHDHKFDPIPQRDYYALAGIFLSTETCYGTAPTFQNLRSAALIELDAKSDLPRMSHKLSVQRRSELEKELTKIERYAAMQYYGTAIKAAFGGKGFDINNDPKKLVQLVAINAKIGELKSELAAYDNEGNAKLLAVGVRDYPATLLHPLPQKPRSLTEAFEFYAGRPNQFRAINDSTLYLRGDVDKPSATVPRGLLSLIGSEPTSFSAGESGRRELAEWLVSAKNPLTSRVFVNRVWHWLFGSGIVDSVDNFGTTGQAPSNQALLDHLAVRLQQLDWSLKALIREIVCSRSYRLATTYNAENFEADPENSLIWRMSPRRLDAECIRDAMLSVSGELQLKPPVGSLVAQQGDASIGGYPIQSMRQPITDDVFLKADLKHRSVYLPVPRNAVPDTLAVFDFNEPNAVGGGRNVTTVPAQALYLLNNDFVDRTARRLADRLAGIEADRRIEAAFQMAVSRTPTAAESDAVTTFLAEYPDQSDSKVAWTSFCRALLSSAEFRSID